MVAQIGGAVATPGVYSLPAGARLDDLVTRAGGLRSDADLARLNLAARIGDGEQVEIPSIEQRATPVPESAGQADAPLIVNINTATLEELDQLPGIGPVIGDRIIAYRDANGPFSSLDELENIDGISANMLARLRPYLTLDD
jgi:competence protein ComEA